MDATDIRILEILQKDARISMKQLAKMINMSAPSAIERVRKLEDSGVITGYRAEVNPKALNRAFSAIVMLVFDSGTQAKFQEYAIASPEITDCEIVTGKFSACVRIACKDMDDFRRVLNEIHGFGASETYVVVDTVKRCACLLPY